MGVVGEASEDVAAEALVHVGVGPGAGGDDEVDFLRAAQSDMVSRSCWPGTMAAAWALRSVSPGGGGLALEVDALGGVIGDGEVCAAGTDFDAVEVFSDRGSTAVAGLGSPTCWVGWHLHAMDTVLSLLHIFE